MLTVRGVEASAAVALLCMCEAVANGGTHLQALQPPGISPRLRTVTKQWSLASTMATTVTVWKRPVVVFVYRCNFQAGKQRCVTRHGSTKKRRSLSKQTCGRVSGALPGCQVRDEVNFMDRLRLWDLISCRRLPTGLAGS